MGDEDKYSKIIEMLLEQNKTIAVNNTNVMSCMPFDHLVQHDRLRNHLAMSPEPKLHGEHHEFTEGMQKHVATVIEVVVKAVGYVIVGAIGLGALAWVSKSNIALPSHNPLPIREYVK